MILPGATGTLATVNTAYLARTLRNEGTFTISSGALGGETGAVFDNGAGATLYLNVDGYDANNDPAGLPASGAARLTNEGSIIKASGTGTTTIAYAIDNNGSMTAQSGTLSMTGGGGSGQEAFSSWNATGSGSSINFAGGNFSLGADVQISGTINVNGTVTAGDIQDDLTTFYIRGHLTLTDPTPSKLNNVNVISGGGLTTVSEADITGTLTASELANITGSGPAAKLVITPTAKATLSPNSGDQVTLTGINFVNQGTLDLALGSITDSGASITNEGVAIVTGSVSGTATFINAAGAVLQKLSGQTATYFGLPFVNQGSVEVDAGELDFTAGAPPDVLGGQNPDPVVCPYAPIVYTGTWTTTNDGSVGFSVGCYELAPGTQINGQVAARGGELALNGVSACAGPSDLGKLTLASGYLNILGTGNDSCASGLVQTGGTLKGSGRLAICSTLAWSGGTMIGPGSTVICPGATGQLTGSVTLNQRTLDNQGQLTWPAGAVSESNGAVLQNSGTFNASSTTGSFSCAPAGDAAGGSLIVNASIVNDPGASSPTDIECPVINNATITASPADLPLPALLNSETGEQGTNGAPTPGNAPCANETIGGASRIPDDQVLPIVEGLVRAPGDPSSDGQVFSQDTYTYPNPNNPGQPGNPNIVVVGESQARVDNFAAANGYSVFQPPQDGASFSEQLARNASWFRGAMDNPNVIILDIGPHENRRSYSWGAILEQALARSRGYQLDQVNIPPAPPDDCTP